MENSILKLKKTDNVIEVLLGKDPLTLEINDHEVFPNSLKQVITWKLAKSLQTGDFTSFQWVDPLAAAGTFDAPEIAPDGNSLSIGDHNGTSAKKGALRYIITVDMAGVIYTSRIDQTSAMAKDPIIINR